MPPEPSAVLVEGAWTHREVTAGGLRIHLAECGPADGPLVVLLHGFPEFWWAWRHQLVGLAALGFHAVAPDLRGYGATDKPPRGYDPYTLCDDVAGLIRALGGREAHLVGHGWGGFLAWTTATLHPRLVRTVAALGMPHPERLRRAVTGDVAQLQATGHIALFQVPKLPERRLESGELVTELMTRWGGPGFPDAETEARCREAMAIPAVAHCSLEYYRWAVRSLTRPSGWRFHRLMAGGVQAPVLQLHGRLDTCMLPQSVPGSEQYARGGYELVMYDGVGHFPHEEHADAVTAALARHASR